MTTMKPNLDTLPTEIIIRIFEFMNFPTLCSSIQTCQTLLDVFQYSDEQILYKCWRTSSNPACAFHELLSLVDEDLIKRDIVFAFLMIAAPEFLKTGQADLLIPIWIKFARSLPDEIGLLQRIWGSEPRLSTLYPVGRRLASLLNGCDASKVENEAETLRADFERLPCIAIGNSSLALVTTPHSYFDDDLLASGMSSASHMCFHCERRPRRSRRSHRSRRSRQVRLSSTKTRSTPQQLCQCRKCKNCGQKSLPSDDSSVLVKFGGEWTPRPKWTAFHCKAPQQPQTPYRFNRP